jgi:phage repressor protein C with HTH and peptisase S24 domain/DNA-binding XRE family transcriptional regulator
LNISLGKILASLRRAKKLTQKDVAARMSNFGHAIKTKTVHNWEKDVAQPKIKQFLSLCELYGVDDPLWTFAGTQSGPLVGLNQAGRDKVADFIGLLLQIDMFRGDGGKSENAAEKAGFTEYTENTESPESPGEQRMLRLYDLPVSAGTGNFLDSSGYEMIEAPSYVSADADFALRVSGDSMEPLLRDGQTIWMKEEQDIKDGDIGVFVYSDDVYCKKLVVKNGISKLKSLNPKYKDIEIKDGFGFAVVGKVIA